MSALPGNWLNARAWAQDDDGLPDAADGITQMAPEPAPVLSFTDAKGAKLSLAEFRGHVLVVNIWATWCGPCADELPTFVTLAAAMKRYGGLVLPISIDVDGANAVSPFYALHNITGLPILLDPQGDDLDILNTDGVPVTMVLNPAGQVVARIDGGAKWDTPRIQAFLRALSKPEGQVAPAQRATVQSIGVPYGGTPRENPRAILTNRLT